MADTPGKLVFWRPADGSGRLVFGDHGGAVAIPDADIALDADFATDMAAHVGLAPAVGLGIDAGFAGDMDASIDAAWDANAHRSTLARAAPHAQQAQPLAAAARAHWQASQPLSVGHRPHWQRAQLIAGTARPHWQASLPLRATARPAFQQGLSAAISLRGGFQQSIALRAAGRPAFQQGLPLAPGWQLGFQQTIALHNHVREHEQFARPIQHAARAPLRAGQPLPRSHRPRFQQGRYPPPGRTPIVIVPPERELCYDPARLGLLVFERSFSGDGKLVFICRKAGGPGPHPGATVVVPIRRVYIVTNDIALIRVDGSVPLPAYAFALSLDADSWTWQWSATLPASVLPNIEPATAGTPVEVQASINGVPYRLLIERVQRARQFAQDRLAVSGRGTAAILDAPYAPVMDFDNASGARSAQQLMGDVLTINGVPIGWAVDFGLTDWAVPAGAWSHQGSYISAINAIAQAAGGYVQPHATAQTLRVLHRYPLAPWDWSTVTPDIELPLAVTSVEGVDWVKKPAYNRVYVSGADGSGILGQVSIAGTPGDESAPMVTDALITHADAARQRGRAILSDTGPQALVSLTLPVLPETGLILPGQFVRRTDGAASVQGYVRATSLQWSRPRMRQTIEVQTHA